MYLKYFMFLVFYILRVQCLTDYDEYDLMPELFNFDDFEKCLFYGSNHSIYCSVTIQLQPKNSTVWYLIQENSANENNYRYDLLRHGVCFNYFFFNRSAEEHLTDLYNKKYKNLGLETKIVKQKCETRSSDYPLETADLILGAILSLYSIWVILVSIYLEIINHQRNSGDGSRERENSKKGDSLIETFFSSFSLFDNWCYLIKAHQEKEDFMLFLQGLRFCAIVVVVATHATEINIIKPVQNPKYVEEMPKRFITMIFANGGMMVKIYFVISSFLMTISFLTKIRNGEKLGFKYVLSSIVGRFLRLTPMYAVMIALHSTWLVHLARGPFWDPIIGEDYRVCRRNWWKNLLYFNNFVINDGFCMFQSWYLSVDLQLYILGILILWMSKKKPKLLFVGAGVLLVCHSTQMFLNLFMNDWEIAVKLTPELMYYFGVVYSKEWQSTWTSTYSNLPGLASGLCCGYLYLKFKNENLFKKTINKSLWWIFSWTLTFGPLLFSSYYMTTQYYSNSKWFAAIYGSFYQIVYTVGCGIVIFGMALGVGGYVKTVLEWAPMHLLGQLSFGTYLIHFTLLKINGAMEMSPIHVTDYLMINDILTNITVSYIFSAILTLFIQVPILRLSKIIIS